MNNRYIYETHLFTPVKEAHADTPRLSTSCMPTRTQAIQE